MQKHTEMTDVLRGGGVFYARRTAPVAGAAGAGVRRGTEVAS